ncbi:N-acetyltransferase 10 [Orbilia oligospora]|uniref:RNA cytidine acetyltransferase n=1 Tax=Orbilia oligospora TaxID=2813651 RepID=A0A7C8J9L6_ORBOL|nr:N-acetyltransferase 10 [Orbilia oligospora]KAF3104486.1 N-acetyltransferase 10 [Orbilia oligospora]KAF3120729.1 N-acetyltransferase 10 [Orbilia oligospora]KAF3191671.1 N-acetyltransferase 10 [Orbilia oligospora]KAF3253065.1 N-acetyltransferase 10 [Orbilia oligospora]
MVKKELDKRITALIRNGVQEKKRSFFIVVGDRAKDVIVHLHYILSHVDIKQNRSVLWAYKQKLIGFTSHRKKREAKIKKEIKRGIREANSEDPFELFVSSQDIRYVYYKETEKILGNTYGMCILQDFEAITPNLLARTIETVEGGGLVIMLLKTMTSLKQLYTMSMDVHSRYRTEAHGDVVARFNERFILSLGDCQSCLVIDDEMNVLPISGARHVKQLPPVSSDNKDSKSKKELDAVKEMVADVQPTSSLVNLAKTADQAQALLTFIKAITEKTLRSTVTLTAGRGRGKSAALGVAIAAAVAYGYSNIFITSPSPENLKTLFQFIFKGFDALGYTDHLDYNIVQSTNPDFNKAIVRVNIFRQHRQTIQYIQPADAHVLGQAELVVIDEAAAIPLPLVRNLLGPYLVFMASTINGYEGTGRSLSLKLIQQLRDQSRNTSKPADSKDNGVPGGRQLQEIVLNEPIRYAPGDSVEEWLNKLLCLNATLPRKSSIKGCPHPDECQLYNVNRDTLFSYNKVCEAFLQNMMALYVASHYKNSPNDLQLMSDAPAHQLFVLLPPIDPNSKEIPEPLCVIQVALEGQISKQSVMSQLGRGQRADGDLIPWLVTQQFQDEDFATLSGARVVRIAVNPEYTKMGYGSKALQLLQEFYEGKFASLDENDTYINEKMVRVTDEELEDASLTTDKVAVREMNAMPPLLLRLNEKRPDELDYLGVSYGLTNQLHRFWKKASFVPVYLRQTPNELTGEHTCVMIKTLAEKDKEWLGAFAKDFHKRFINLLAYQFRAFPSVQSLSIMESATAGAALANIPTIPLRKDQLDEQFSPFDLKRLESYANSMLDHHVITDLVPLISSLYFTGKLPATAKLSGVQSAILLAIGLQKKTTEDVEKELNLPNQQVLAMFVKIMRKVSTALGGIVSQAIEETLPAEHHGRKKVGAEEAIDGGEDEEMADVSKRLKPLEQTLEEDLEEGADEVKIALKEKQRELINALDLQKYEIPSASGEWEDAEKQVTGGNSTGRSTTISVKSSKQIKRKAGESAAEIYEKEMSSTKSSKKNKRK